MRQPFVLLLACVVGHTLVACSGSGSGGHESKPPPVPAIVKMDPAVAEVSAAYAAHMSAVYDILDANKAVPDRAAELVEAYATRERERVEKLKAMLERLRAVIEEQPAAAVVLLRHMRPVGERAESLMLANPALMSHTALQVAMTKVLPSGEPGDPAAGGPPMTEEPNSELRTSRSECRNGQIRCACASDDRCLPKFTCNKCCAGIGPPGIPGCSYPPRKPPKGNCTVVEEPCACASGFKCLSAEACTGCCGSVDSDPTKVPEECWQ